MKLILLIAISALLVSCAGSGPNGEWTPADTSAALGAFDHALDSYQRAQNVYNGQTYP